MLISMLVRRTPAQQAQARLTVWTVQQGTRELATVVWDPSGPLDAREAAMAALSELLRCLSALPPARTQTAVRALDPTL